MKNMYLDGNKIAIKTPYNQQEVEALKAGIKTARWDRLNKIWHIPIKDIRHAINFAKAWNINISEELQHIEIPANPFETPQITQTENHIHIKIPYDNIIINELQKLPETTWDPQTQQWTTPKENAEQIQNWANKFDIPIPQHIQQTITQQQQNADQSIQLSHATDADIHINNLLIELYPYQKAGVQYATQKRRTFIADEMGLGKSIQAIATIEHNNTYPCLLVVPPSLTADWQNKIEHGVKNRTTQTIEGRKTPPPLTADYIIIGYPNLHHHKTTLAKHGFNSLILDESHYCKNPDAQRTKAAKHIASKIPETGNILLLTGTPLSNKPAEYAAQLQILNHINTFGGTWQFYKKYCDAHQDQYGHWHKDGATNLPELQTKLRQNCYIRREKTQVLTDLPPITYNTITTQMPPKHQKEYNHALNNLLDWYTQQQQQLAKQNGTNPTAAKIKAHFATLNHEQIIQLTALRLITAQAKIETALEWIHNANQQGQKIVIAAHHRQIVQTIAQHTGGLHIIGGQNPQTTEQHKHQFNTNPNHMNITISQTAAAHGHTLTAAHNMLIIEPPWTPTIYRQTTARIHRIGQTQPTTIHNLIIPNTIDTHVYTRLQQKIENTDPAVTTNPQLTQLINHLTQ